MLQDITTSASREVDKKVEVKLIKTEPVVEASVEAAAIACAWYKFKWANMQIANDK